MENLNDTDVQTSTDEMKILDENGDLIPPKQSQSNTGLNPKKATTESRSNEKKKSSRTARGTSIGNSLNPRDKAEGGLNPIAGLDVSLEEAEKILSQQNNKNKKTSNKNSDISQVANTATVTALANLIEHGREELKGDPWVPHRPHRPQKN